MSLRALAKDVLPPVAKRSLRRALEGTGILQKSAPKQVAVALPTPSKTVSVTEYWTSHNVTVHQKFRSPEASLDSFDWRSGQYFGYLDLLPVSGHDGQVILDYGCGPGHDLVGFAHFSKPDRLVGADVSSTSLAEARSRLALHGYQAELVMLQSQSPRLPFDDATFDYAHCSGVIMCVEDPVAVMKELRRVLKPSGEARFMVYNYHSLWLHLYVAYVNRIEQKRYADLSLEDAFCRLTDGPECPISRAWTPEQFSAIAREAGFDAHHLGNAVSAFEMDLLPRRFSAIQHPDLPRPHRTFLRELTFDQRALPMYRGQYAGIDACYRLKRR